MKQIAQRTGLSIPTVHQVLNGYKVRFSDQTRRKVLEAAKELNYRPNIAARGLRARKSYLLGLQFNAVNYSLIAGFTRGFQATCTAGNYAPVFLMHETTEDEAANTQTLLDRRVDGIVVNCAVDSDGRTNATQLSQMRRAGTHLVEVFGRFIEGAPRVTIDYRAGAIAATRLLIENGHTHIALLTHDGYRACEKIPGLYWTAWEHWQGYGAAMRSAGLEELTVTYPVSQDRTREGAQYFGAYEMADGLFRHERRPTAVVCYRGEAAEALIHRANAHPGLAPAGFAISVFDSMRPTLTELIDLNVLPLPAEDVGSAAARMLLDLMAGREVVDLAMGPRMPGAL